MKHAEKLKNIHPFFQTDIALLYKSYQFSLLFPSEVLNSIIHICQMNFLTFGNWKQARSKNKIVFDFLTPIIWYSIVIQNVEIKDLSVNPIPCREKLLAGNWHHLLLDHQNHIKKAKNVYLYWIRKVTKYSRQEQG